jgi:hypothetical protein
MATFPPQISDCQRAHSLLRCKVTKSFSYCDKKVRKYMGIIFNLQSFCYFIRKEGSPEPECSSIFPCINSPNIGGNLNRFYQEIMIKSMNFKFK